MLPGASNAVENHFFQKRQHMFQNLQKFNRLYTGQDSQEDKEAYNVAQMTTSPKHSSIWKGTQHFSKGTAMESGTPKVSQKKVSTERWSKDGTKIVAGPRRHMPSPPQTACEGPHFFLEAGTQRWRHHDRSAPWPPKGNVVGQGVYQSSSSSRSSWSSARAGQDGTGVPICWRPKIIKINKRSVEEQRQGSKQAGGRPKNTSGQKARGSQFARTSSPRPSMDKILSNSSGYCMQQGQDAKGERKKITLRKGSTWRSPQTRKAVLKILEATTHHRVPKGRRKEQWGGEALHGLKVWWRLHTCLNAFFSAYTVRASLQHHLSQTVAFVFRADQSFSICSKGIRETRT